MAPSCNIDDEAWVPIVDLDHGTCCRLGDDVDDGMAVAALAGLDRVGEDLQRTLDHQGTGNVEPVLSPGAIALHEFVAGDFHRPRLEPGPLTGKQTVAPGAGAGRNAWGVVAEWHAPLDPLDAAGAGEDGQGDVVFVIEPVAMIFDCVAQGLIVPNLCRLCVPRL